MSLVLHMIRIASSFRFFSRLDYRIFAQFRNLGIIPWNGFWAYRLFWCGGFGFGFAKLRWIDRLNEHFPRVAARLPEWHESQL